MIEFGSEHCPTCKNKLIPRAKVKRKITCKFGVKRTLYLNLFYCGNCRTFHRELHPRIKKYKHYELDIIEGVIEGFITDETIGFEDYPSAQTMRRWLNEKL